MSEGGEPASNANSDKKGTGGGGRGRGRGRGRGDRGRGRSGGGRGGGRGGRGRGGRSNHHNDSNDVSRDYQNGGSVSNGTTTTKATSDNQDGIVGLSSSYNESSGSSGNDNNNYNSHDDSGNSGREKGGHRSGGGSGRGGGGGNNSNRGRNKGRGGRGGRFNNRNRQHGGASRSNSPVPPSGEDEGEALFARSNENALSGAQSSIYHEYGGLPDGMAFSKQQSSTMGQGGGLGLFPPAQGPSMAALATESLDRAPMPMGFAASGTVPLSLPPPPHSNRKTGKGGIPMILSRNSNPAGMVGTFAQSSLPSQDLQQEYEVDYDSEAHKLSESLAAAALEDSFDKDEEEKKDVSGVDNSPPPAAKESMTSPVQPPSKGKSNRPKKKSRNKKDAENATSPPTDEVEDSAADVTTTDALNSLPAQEVSITANTTVQIRRSESSASVDKLADGLTSKAGAAGKSKKGGKSRKKKALSKDDAANQRAAKQFNKSVRLCVDRGDADGVREILHDRRNHNFALDKNVLETVMKAFVVAAMFEEGLYCLRNCTLPGTLATSQTERILTCMPQNLRNSSAYTAADMIDALCIATEFDKPTSRTYFLRIVRGISLEFLEEVMSARDRICSAPCERLVRSAVCVVDARFKRGKKATELIVQPGEQLGIFVPDSMENRGIQSGDAVSILPYAGPYPMSAESLDRNMIEATVTNSNPMVLRFNEKLHISVYNTLTEQIEGNVYRVDKLANRMGFNRQLSAAVAISSPLGDSKTRDTRRPSPQLIKAITAMDENIGRAMNQPGNNPYGALNSTAALCNGAVPWSYDNEVEGVDDDDASRAASGIALEKHGLLEGLNASQRRAVEGAVTNRLTLVQGPPGTVSFL